jgi:Tfp pilus assembly protein PilF
MRPAALPPFLPLVLLVSALFVGGCAANSLQSEFEPPQRLPAVGAGGYVELGRRLLQIDQPELAYKAFLNAIRVDGLTADALIGAGLASEQQGLLTSARRYFKKAVEIDTNSAEAHNNLGVVLFRLREYHAARDAFRAAFALSSGRSGIAERNLNRAEAVVAQLEEAEQTDPAVSHRVVRLGTSEFRITPSATTPAEMMGAE